MSKVFNRLTTRFLIFWGMVVSGVVTLISGLILWFAPHGPHSKEVILYGLQKSTWLDIHPYVALLAIGLVAVHLIDKWRYLKIYTKSPFKKGLLIREKEIECEVLRS